MQKGSATRGQGIIGGDLVAVGLEDDSSRAPINKVRAGFDDVGYVALDFGEGKHEVAVDHRRLR